MPRCIVVGCGRIVGGFVAPMFRSADWDVVLACRNGAVRRSINRHGGVSLRIVGDPPDERWIDGVSAVALDDAALGRLAAEADLLATAVGPSSLHDAGTVLAPLARTRLEVARAPLNIITFENHRRAPELLAGGLMEREPSLAPMIGRRLGVAGAAVWRAVSHRELTDDGVRFHAEALGECYVDARALAPGAPPLDGSLAGCEAVDFFDTRMVEKLWVFNAGHAAAAYFGWQAGAPTIDAAMADPAIRRRVHDVVEEAQRGVDAWLAASPGEPRLPARDPEWILRRYSDPALADPVARVAREPRRKLASGDRLMGPAVALLDSGGTPAALADAAAAALAYRHAGDGQATDLGWELELLGPEEVLATVSGLDPSDRLTRMISDCYRERATMAVAR